MLHFLPPLEHLYVIYLRLYSLSLLHTHTHRYSGLFAKRLQHPQEIETTTANSKHSMRLVTILLSAYCKLHFAFHYKQFLIRVIHLVNSRFAGLLGATLAIFIKITLSNDVSISTTLCWIFIPSLIVSLVIIIFVLGTQSNENAIFSFNLKHPFLPATILFACIYLFTAVSVAAWIRLTTWMIIGSFLIFFNDLTNCFFFYSLIDFVSNVDVTAFFFKFQTFCLSLFSYNFLNISLFVFRQNVLRNELKS